MKHICFDLETWGRLPGCAIRSVAAVAFELGGKTDDEVFYRNIDERSCWIAGLRCEPETEAWWKERPKAEALLLTNQVSLGMAIIELHTFYRTKQAKYLWANGANFDEPIWQIAARRVGQVPPWPYHSVRCVRTLHAVAGFDQSRIKREGALHDARLDVLHQVKCMQAAYRLLKQEEAV